LARRQSKPVAAETMLGLILSQQGKREDARKHFERALALDSRATVAANNLAWDYANYGGNLDMALQLAQTAKSQSPLNSDVSDTLGWIYYKKGLARLAVTTLREAAQQNPTSPDIQYHLGLALLKDGQKIDAKAALQHVLKLNPQYADADEVRRVLAGIES
jgi:tetratricopeptide (TPR) repeat protein